MFNSANQPKTTLFEQSNTIIIIVQHRYLNIQLIFSKIKAF